MSTPTHDPVRVAGEHQEYVFRSIHAQFDLFLIMILLALLLAYIAWVHTELHRLERD